MKILLTKRAEKNYRSIIEYLTTEWSDNVAQAFEQKTISLLDLLEEFPEIGIIEVEAKQIRSFLYTKQTRVFYRLKGNQIIILSFFDVRQNPKKRPK
jgi:plasmid stabilization system protein ParE